MTTYRAAIVGPGNIGTDLLIKLQGSERIDTRYMIGVDPTSDGLRRAEELGVEASAGGVEWLLEQHDAPDVVLEATSARAHESHAPLYEEAGIRAVDLTPAAIGPYVVPALEDELADAMNVNMITCGGQATIPIVRAVSRVVDVSYAEIVASIASRSAGPGTRANIDEFTQTTAQAIEEVGRAKRGKAIIILNPAEPKPLMRDTIFCAIPADCDTDAIAASVERMVAKVSQYVPGYRLKAAPQFDPPRSSWGGNGRVSVFLEVEGRGDYLPPYAGNLDIMTAAAAQVAEQWATSAFKTAVGGRA